MVTAGGADGAAAFADGGRGVHVLARCWCTLSGRGRRHCESSSPGPWWCTSAVVELGGCDSGGGSVGVGEGREWEPCRLARWQWSRVVVEWVLDDWTGNCAFPFLNMEYYTFPCLHIPFWFHSHIPFHSDEKSHRVVELTEMQVWNLFLGLKIWNGTVVALDSESEQRWSFLWKLLQNSWNYW